MQDQLSREELEEWERELDAAYAEARDERGLISADVWHELEDERMLLEAAYRELRDGK